MKKLCSFSKEDIKSNFEILKEKVKISESQFVCKKCMRSSNDSGVLCKPEEV